MATQVQFRRANTANTAAITGAIGELTVDTDKNTVVVHDGSTAGGFALAKENAASFSTSITLTGNLSVSDTTSIGNSTVNTPVNSSIITVSSANVTTNTFTLGSSSDTANGYTVLPNGLIMQWGSVQSNSTVGDITFTTGFTTVYSVTVTAETSTYDGTYSPLLIASNTTTANVRTANDTAITVFYQAIGNN